uniref:Endonuclease/exonuclease/phosphatase domain-containing protein n=1 Tax=Octopus bimaculoides TaxID=37653 RepID=A0A0L8HDZ5_OCTBM
MLEEFPVGINERLMSMRIPLVKGNCVTLVSVYAPTMCSTNDEKVSFYHALKVIIRNIPRADKVIVLGNFNARVGRDFNTWTVIGKHGVGKCNSNGMILLQMCEELRLCVINTMFQQKNKFKTTWMHPASKEWHILDYILVRMSDRRDVWCVRVLRGVECWTDHCLVRAKVKLITKRKIRAAGITLPKRLNVARLSCNGVKRTLREEMNVADFGEDWSTLKKSVYDIGR